MTQLTVDGVSLGYDGNTIVRDLTFGVNNGDYLCIVGENGTGKSTLLKTLLGLHKQTAGTIGLGGGSKRAGFGYLPQQKDIQKDFPASVNEIVLSGCLSGCGLRPFYTKKEKALAAENLDKLGIAGLADRCYRELSGGQQQRVLLARALCAAKTMIFLDEPVAGLDPQATKEMYDTIFALNHDGGMTVVMVSHDISAAVEYASHILHIGKTSCFFGSSAEYARDFVRREGAL
ncbi:MAG: ABC transporter ATP-binding protein [Clostridiales bacterium]|jgi:zinc transport system ATP-binding protein|nr:ABC transporter ATP-binding protein [Clostridiales bacterium]